jgi:hypothetical protein
MSVLAYLAINLISCPFQIECVQKHLGSVVHGWRPQHVLPCIDSCGVVDCNRGSLVSSEKSMATLRACMPAPRQCSQHEWRDRFSSVKA